MSQPQIDRREMSLMQKLAVPEANDTPWSVMVATLTVLVLLMTMMLIGPAIVSQGDGQAVSPFLLMLSWAIGQTLTILFVVVNRRSSAESWQALKLNQGLLALPLALLIGVAIALSIDVLIGLFSGQFLPIPEIFGFQTAGTTGIIVAAVFLILIQPIAESLVFQGVLLPKLRVIMGPWGGVVMTTVIFTLIHYGIFYSSYDQSYPPSAMLWYGAAYPLLAGFLFSLLKVYTQSTLAVIVARMGAGMIFLLTALVLMTG